MVRKVIPMKNNWSERTPELIIGEGSGCIMYSACESPIRRAAKKSTLKSEVNTGRASKARPIWSKTPVTAKMKATRKRGSVRKRPVPVGLHGPKGKWQVHHPEGKPAAPQCSRPAMQLFSTEQDTQQAGGCRKSQCRFRRQSPGPM